VFRSPQRPLLFRLPVTTGQRLFGSGAIWPLDLIDLTDRFVNPVSKVTIVNTVIAQPSRKRLVQQRLLQRLQRGELLPIEAGEALGCGVERSKVFGSMAATSTLQLLGESANVR